MHVYRFGMGSVESKEEGLMTEERFDELLRQWSFKVKMVSEGKLLTGTHSSGKLRASLSQFVDKMRDNVGRHIAYRFEQYGVFRSYGAGRGWVVIGGKPVPGKRVVSLKALRKGKSSWIKIGEVQALKKRGYLDKDIRNAKVKFAKEVKNKRTPLDWLDATISSNFQQLADIAQEYFGDKALSGLAQSIEKAKIRK